MTTKEQILKCFKDIDHAYNDCTRYDTLKCMLDELQEPCEDAISREAVLDSIHANCVYENEYNLTAKHIEDAVKQLPSVNPQKPICPSAGIDCEDCPAYEDAISRKAVMEICNEEWDSDLIVERIGQLPSVSSSEKPKSEWEQDHEILKAYSDGANEVLDKVRAEIDAARFLDKDKKLFKNANASGLEVAMDIIDKYIEEGKG